MMVVRLSWGRLILALVTMLAFLQVLHMALLNRLEARNAEVEKVRMRKMFQDEREHILQSMRDTIDESQIVDSSGEYKVVNFVWQGDTWMKRKKTSFGVTVITQCSLNHLHHLISLSEQWQGPISVAVFTSVDYISLLMEAIVQLLQCSPSFRQNVSVHLIHPLQASQATSPSDSVQDLYCSNIKEWLSKQLPDTKNYALNGISYPNNLLRNIAVMHARTDFVFVIDVDMLPSFNLQKHFSEFLERQAIATATEELGQNIAYVVPAFELQRNIPMPQDKRTVLHLWKSRKLRPFYFEPCWKCQRHTDYSAWKNLSLSTELQVGYEVGWKDPWEPFYIARKSQIKYDERFRQYGYNRISQVCEMHISGCKFAVLNNAFLIHKGFKTLNSFHSTKEQENDRNRILYRQFKEELKTKYPQSTRRCY